MGCCGCYRAREIPDLPRNSEEVYSSPRSFLTEEETAAFLFDPSKDDFVLPSRESMARVIASEK
jgi:hypothetical protein